MSDLLHGLFEQLTGAMALGTLLIHESSLVRGSQVQLEQIHVLHIH